MEVIMKRRLYFLLPDTAYTPTVVEEPETSGIERSPVGSRTGAVIH
jgi:hypothetical protein